MYMHGQIWNRKKLVLLIVMLQMIGNLITGFDGSGVYVLTESAGDASGEPVVLFNLAQVVLTQSIQ